MITEGLRTLVLSLCLTVAMLLVGLGAAWVQWTSTGRRLPGKAMAAIRNSPRASESVRPAPSLGIDVG